MPNRNWEGPPLFSAYQARPLLEAMKAGQLDTATSFDLGRSTLRVEIGPDGVAVGRCLLTQKALQNMIREDRKVFRLDSETPESVSLFSESTRWVRSLCPTASAPTVLVSGIPMHRIKNTDPMADTQAKIKALGKVHGRVLDTATGLGYTAIEAARSAKEVVTVEIDPGALEIARLNPWSHDLFARTNIRQIVGDVFEVVKDLAAGSFEAVIHDPPTVSLGGELYGVEFYGELRRILRRGGRLFHYVGDPEGGVGRKMLPGITRRLTEAGFHRIEKQPAAFGLTAVARP